MQLGEDHGFLVDATEDADVFSEGALRQYRAVVFLNTTGDILDDAQQVQFERYIQAGGGYVGIHAATDTEYDWPWYGRLAGAYFVSHPNNPNVRTGTFRILDHDHASTRGLPEEWIREDEFYNFRSINPDINVLVDIDEESYEGGTNGEYHPMSWYHSFDGGRAWYTNMGHTEATYREPLFLQHLAGGLEYAMGTKKLDYEHARPDEDRFTKVVLTEGLDEPLELTVLPDERVLFVERGGAIYLYSPASEALTRIARLDVSTTYTDGAEAEDGLLGIAADPNFARNGWIYLFYSPAGDEAKNVLARYPMEGDTLHMMNGQVILEVPVQRDECCHTGGSIAFDAQGNLYLSTGDNTNPNATGFAPIDERPGRGAFDAQKSSSNTNDLRGKILRIRVQDDGSYTIPEGNLFAPGTPGTRPEIYSMGHRNPYRISVDQRTGYVYWGDVGPDAARDSLDRGPAGMDEFGQARSAGNFGWPYFAGNNTAYHDYDFATRTAGEAFDPAHPVNDSPNNTGLDSLPPARSAFLWYAAAPSDLFPLFGSGGRSAMAGPVYHLDDFPRSDHRFPEYYDGNLFLYEWMRGWIIAVTMDNNGDYESMERFMPSHRFSNPIDMEFGPLGNLYVLEYGTSWFEANDDARLVRIEYSEGNRVPVAIVSLENATGSTPFTVALSPSGTMDPDGDSLSYEWTVMHPDGLEYFQSTEVQPSVTIEEPGIYGVALEVTDDNGETASAAGQIIAGNEPPKVSIELQDGNRTFYRPGQPVRYNVHVEDLEDGSLASGSIAAEDVSVGLENLSSSAEEDDPGRQLVESATCLTCHSAAASSIGPSYEEVATRYATDTEARARLMTRIREGGSGVWGPVMMPPHPQYSDDELRQMVDFVLGLGRDSDRTIPTEGMVQPPAEAGSMVLRATYTDRGAGGIPASTSEATLTLRAPSVVIADGVLSEGALGMNIPQMPVELTVVLEADTWAQFAEIDLSGVREVQITAMTPPQMQASGGIVELRLDAPDGELIGTTDPITGVPDGAVFAIPVEDPGRITDVFLVFRKLQEDAVGGIFVLTTAEFVQ